MILPSDQQKRRYPINAGDSVRHVDGRCGVAEVCGFYLDGLPAALVRFPNGREKVVLGYLERVGSLEAG